MGEAFADACSRTSCDAPGGLASGAVELPGRSGLRANDRDRLPTMTPEKAS